MLPNNCTDYCHVWGWDSKQVFLRLRGNAIWTWKTLLLSALLYAHTFSDNKRACNPYFNLNRVPWTRFKKINVMFSAYVSIRGCFRRMLPCNELGCFRQLEKLILQPFLRQINNTKWMAYCFQTCVPRYDRIKQKVAPRVCATYSKTRQNNDSGWKNNLFHLLRIAGHF